jgi:uncharacterized protein YjbJ (UPF0337 family)
MNPGFWRGVPGTGIRRPREKEVVLMSNTDDAKGRVKEAVGDLTGNDDLKNEGKVDRATGKVKEGVDKAADKIKGND